MAMLCCMRVHLPVLNGSLSSLACARTQYGTALHFAASDGHPECVELLMLLGANKKTINPVRCSALSRSS
jgi:hypothetical protein